jgi:uncharacterized RDD family membrane protein YckC
VSAPVASLVPCPNHADVTEGLASCSVCGRNFCGDCLVSLGGQPTCADCKLERLSALRSGGEELDLASPGARFVGQFVDGLLFTFPLIVGVVAFFAFGFDPVHMTTNPSSFAPLVVAGLFFAATVTYEALMLTARGQTLGKMAAGTKVVTMQGGRISAAQAWIRASTRGGMSMLYCLGPIDALYVFSARHRTLHDRLAQTLVVKA